MLVLQVDCGDMRNVDNFGIVKKLLTLVKLVLLVLYVDCGDMRNVDNFGIIGKAGKVSNAGAVGQLWQHEKC